WPRRSPRRACSASLRCSTSTSPRRCRAVRAWWSSSRPRPIPATPGRSCARRTPPGPTPWCSPRARPTRTAASACARRPAACGTCPWWSGCRSPTRSRRCTTPACPSWPPAAARAGRTSTSSRTRGCSPRPPPGCSATRQRGSAKRHWPAPTARCASRSTGGPSRSTSPPPRRCACTPPPGRSAGPPAQNSSRVRPRPQPRTDVQGQRRRDRRGPGVVNCLHRPAPRRTVHAP
ncbi:MAG: RNA methyltransferase, TrmH family, partial [uncultured Frankineae bacterium]